MTGTELEITFDAASADLVPNVTLARMMHQEFEVRRCQFLQQREGLRREYSEDVLK